MKVFRSPDGRIVQLADEKKMEKWDAEMPLIFLGDIREKRLPAYRKDFPKKMVDEIEKYLDEVMVNVAVPKLINSINSPDPKERLKIAENFLKLSENNPDQLAVALPHVEKAMTDTNKEVADTMKKAYKNYNKAQKRKQTAEKRKKLTEFRKKMDELDDRFASGEITDIDYLKEQKAFLKLKREITTEEMDEDEKKEDAEKQKKKK